MEDDELGLPSTVPPVLRWLNRTTTSSGDPIYLEDLEPGIYAFGSSGGGWQRFTSTNIHFRGKREGTTQAAYTPVKWTDSLLYVHKKYHEAEQGDTIVSYRADGYLNTVKKWSSISGLSFSSTPDYMVTSKSDHTIEGKLTYNVLPESNVIPTTNNQLINKKYADDKVSEATKVKIIYGVSTSNPFTLEDHGPGLYVFYSAPNSMLKSSQVPVRATSEHQKTDNLNNMENAILYVLKKPSEAGNREVIAVCKTAKGNTHTIDNGPAASLTTSGLYYSTNKYGADLDSVQTFSQTTTFNNYVVAAKAPTTDNHLTNKKYVDDEITKASGGKVPTGINLFYWDGKSSLDNADNLILFQNVLNKYLAGEPVYVFTKRTHTIAPTMPTDFSLILSPMRKTTTQILFRSAKYASDTQSGQSWYWYEGNCTIQFDSNNIVESVGAVGFGTQPMPSDIVTFSNTQVITGKKTFSTLPESGVVPTTNDQLANKKYVDDAIAALKAELGGS